MAARGLRFIIMVGATGFEPATPCAQGRCATRLRYAPTCSGSPSASSPRRNGAVPSRPIEREHEARALFRISRTLATRPRPRPCSTIWPAAVKVEADLDRVLVALSRPSGGERVVTDTGGPVAAPDASLDHAVLRRTPGDTPARWIQVHPPAGPKPAEQNQRAYRVVIEAAGEGLGSIWAVRGRNDGEPGRSATRLLAAAADQIGQAYEQDRLAAEARTAEVARRSDAAKTALLESVSHDLRTPWPPFAPPRGPFSRGRKRSPKRTGWRVPRQSIAKRST